MSEFSGRGSARHKRPPGLHRRFPPRAREDGTAHRSNDRAEVIEAPEDPADSAPPETSANECFVCCRDIDVFAVGLCDHPVCHVCSTRLRVLCETNECPVCRADMEEVFFAEEVSAFEDLKKKHFDSKAEQFGIFFENEGIFAKYTELLTNKCNECIRRANISERSGERSHPPECYENFEALREHVQRDHKRQFCDLCVEHLKLFSFERQAYSKSDLRRHLREGDLNDKSHKGHPRCDFCDIHYLDKDELYKHLKIDHFSCFICQRGNAACRLQQYYAQYEHLHQHFLRDHFLCDQGECANERFVAFETKLEYKAHVATKHSDSLSREEQRAARDLAVDFAMSPPGRDNFRGDGGSAPSRRGNRDNHRDRLTSGRERGRRPSPEPVPEHDEGAFAAPSVDTTSTKDFPSLLGDSAVSRPLIPTPRYSARMSLVKSAEEFPSLGVPMNPPASTSHTWLRPVGKSKPSAARAAPKPTLTPLSPAHTTQLPSRSPNPKSAPDVFPSLPQPAGESDFGKVLKPLAAKKAPKARHVKAVQEKRPVIGSNFSVQMNSSSKNRPQQSTPNDKGAPKGPGSARSTEDPVHELTTDFSQLNRAKAPNNDLNKFDFRTSGASWAAESNSNQSVPEAQPIRSEKKIKQKIPKQEDFPSLGPAKPEVGAPSGFIPKRSKYKGIKPGNLGQENRASDDYIQPPNFARRTTEFMGLLKLLLNGNAEHVTEYRLAMTNFRKGFISGEELVHSCLQLFGDTSEFTKIFVELVCLVPDIEKQNELIRLYDNLKTEYGSQKKTNAREWTRCSECGQIMIPEDSQTHQKAH